jgi:hypothetical protein
MPRKVIIDLAEILQYCTSHKIDKVKGEKPGDTQEIFSGQLGKNLIPYDAPSRRIKSAAKLLSKSSKKRKRSEKRRSEKRRSSKKKRKINDEDEEAKKKSISLLEEEEVIGTAKEYGIGGDSGKDDSSEHDVTEKQKTDTENSSSDSGNDSDKGSSEGSSEEESENESSSDDSGYGSTENSDTE